MYMYAAFIDVDAFSGTIIVSLVSSKWASGQFVRSIRISFSGVFFMLWNEVLKTMNPWLKSRHYAKIQDYDEPFYSGECCVCCHRNMWERKRPSQLTDACESFLWTHTHMTVQCIRLLGQVLWVRCAWGQFLWLFYADRPITICKENILISGIYSPCAWSLPCNVPSNCFPDDLPSKHSNMSKIITPNSHWFCDVYFVFSVRFSHLGVWAGLHCGPAMD